MPIKAEASVSLGAWPTFSSSYGPSHLMPSLNNSVLWAKPNEVGRKPHIYPEQQGAKCNDHTATTKSHWKVYNSGLHVWELEKLVGGNS